jgi:hypothetical protein
MLGRLIAESIEEVLVGHASLHGQYGGDCDWMVDVRRSVRILAALVAMLQGSEAQGLK